MFMGIVQTTVKSSIYLRNSIQITEPVKITASSLFVSKFAYHQDLLGDPFCSKTLSNHPHKSMTL